MKVCVLAILTASLLLAADDRELALQLKAQTDFDRVELTPRPSIPATETCLQSEAAALAIAPLTERALLLYRKGYCTLALAALTQNARQYQAAASTFDEAILAWPDRQRKNAKNVLPDPVSSALRVYAGIARLHGSAGSESTAAARQEISAALEAPACNSNLMSAATCNDVLAVGAEWLGWIALRDNQVDEALRRFPQTTDTGWRKWAEGRREFDAKRYSAAVPYYTSAIDQWKRIWQGQGPTFRQSLGPRPKIPTALADLGSAKMLAGDLPGAISTLDASLQADPKSAHALFLRGRAKELAGRKEDALTDFNLASRNAFAESPDLASGEAHLYRGIGLFRRQDYARAEQEFATSLTLEMPETLKPDARAWRELAAVSQGSCGPARESLTQALATVSPYFPRDEARAAAGACGATSQRN